MSNRETTIQQVAQAINDIGAANTNLQAADDWLETATERQAEDFGEDSTALLRAATEAAEDAISAIATAGVALEAFKEALEALA